MKIIVGLGNPGREYERTPHNAGFRAADALALSLGASWKAEPKWKAHVAKARGGASPLLIAKPQTFMNLSGDAVAPLAAFYKAKPEDVIVIVDEVNLDPGRIRVRPSGSDGGHNGLKSVTERLGTQTYPRVRIGVGMGRHPVPDLVSRVLGRIDAEDEEAVGRGIALAAEAALCVADKGVDFAMNKYNGPETV
ncbi:MAG: aminoacyl-tRNA hydrolase [Kiritimatiellae bacterium]|nr:aminoacyl-tRNA hydrolase [Kiritimatiellia bacterium]